MEKTTATLPFPNTKLFSSLRLNPYLLTLSALPFLLFFLKPTYILCMFDFLDPWIYFGYFKDLKQHLNTFPGAYYGTRLPWILVGHITYKIFTPLVAKYFLYLLLYYTSLFSCYGILKRTIGLKTAFFTAILLGFYNHFLVSSGSEYIDGIAQSYFFLCLFSLTPSKDKTFPSFRYLLPGIFFSLLMFTHLYLTVYLPLIGCFYFYFHRPKKVLIFIFHLSLFLLGYLLMTLLLCTINYLLCNDFFFYSHMYIWTKNFVKQANPWWYPFSHWKHLLNCYILGMFTLISSLFFLLYRKIIPKNLPKGNILFFQILFLLNASIFLYFEFVKKQPFLEYKYYYSYLTPLLFLALGSLLSIRIESMSTKKFYVMLSILISLSIFEASFSSKIVYFFESYTKHFWPYFLASALISLFGTLFLKRKWALPFLLLITILIFSNGKGGLGSAFEDMPYKTGRNMFLSIDDAVNTVKKMDKAGNSFFWYSIDEPYYRTIYIATCSTYLWGYRLVNEKFPTTVGNFDYPFIDLTNKSFFVLSTKPSVNEAVNEALLPKGLIANLKGHEMLKRGNLQFNIFHFKAEKIEDKGLHDDH